MSDTISIRPYKDADLETIRRITVEAFRGVSIDHNMEVKFGLIAGRDWQWRKGRHIDVDVGVPHARVWVAENAEKEIVGCITTRLDREAKVGLIPNLVVKTGMRGQGIGRKLIEHALDVFRHEGMEVARIETLEQNAVGKHLYPQCGFEEVAKQIHFAMRL